MLLLHPPFFLQISRVDEVSGAAAADRLRAAEPAAGVRHAEELEGGWRQYAATDAFKSACITEMFNPLIFKLKLYRVHLHRVG